MFKVFGNLTSTPQFIQLLWDKRPNGNEERRSDACCPGSSRP